MQVVLEMVYLHRIHWQDVLDFPGNWEAMSATRDGLRRAVDDLAHVEPEVKAPSLDAGSSAAPAFNTPPKGKRGSSESEDPPQPPRPTKQKKASPPVGPM
jgi:hypothetical protein